MKRLKCKLMIFLLLFGFILFLKTGMVTGNINNRPDPFFSVHLIAPTSCPVRMQYTQLVEPELNKIGIEAELDLISWAALGPRCTDQEVGTYNEGGYDISFFGMSLGTPFGHPGKNLLGVFGADAIPSGGFNVMYWSPELGKNYNNYRAQESEDLLQKIATNPNLLETKEDLIEWQKIWYDVMPNIVIYNQYEVHAISTGLYGYDPLCYPLNSIENFVMTNEYTGTPNQVVLAASTGGDTFNPVLATDVYDQYVNNPAFDRLIGNAPSKEVFLPFDIDQTSWLFCKCSATNYLDIYPRVAASLGSYSADGLEYEIAVQKGVYWHDGHELDAWDVAFSFQVHLIPILNPSLHKQSWRSTGWLESFGYDDKFERHGNYSFIVSDRNYDSFYEHIKFNLNETYAPFETESLGTFLLPEHILGDPFSHGFNPITGDFDPVNQWIVSPTDWRYHSTTTGRRTDPGGYPGPIGCGSMIFKEFDSPKNIITLEKFEDIKWDNTTSQWVHTPGISHWNIHNLNDMPDTVKVITSSMDSAIADMKTGGVNIMDPQFTMANILDELQTEASIQPIMSAESGWQALYMNPKFKQDDVFHFQKKGVRHAISHILPREKIVTILMNDLGLPAYTPMPSTSWAAISESEMVNYKKSLVASDNSTLLANSSTAYDQYSQNLAFDWLDTEGYDTTPWRLYSGDITTPKLTLLTPGFELLITTMMLAFGIILFRRN